MTKKVFIKFNKTRYMLPANQQNKFLSGRTDELIIAKECQTLVILLGNARGGEQTWQTMYKNLLEPYNADLALCFGEEKDKSSSLYKKAKHIWEVPEHSNWRIYYDNNFNRNWGFFFSLHADTGLMGGIDNTVGSGSIVFALRDFILKNKIDFLKLYDRIILTRSDFYYIDKHPILPLGKLYAVEGEEYGGICDRHFVFDSSMAHEVLGICNFLCCENNFKKLSGFLPNSINVEKALKIFFDHTGVSEKLEKCKRVQFTVSIDNDPTRWSKGNHNLPGSKTLKIKYYSEFEQALQNIITKKGWLQSMTDKFLIRARIAMIQLKLSSLFINIENTRRIIQHLVNKYFGLQF